MFTYLSATRHPWACLAFLLPLLVVYEGGVVWFGGPNADALRNGADVWFRAGLSRYGIVQMWAAPLVVCAVFVVRSWANWADRPKHLLTVTFGMAVESVVFAVGLWVLARNFGPLVRDWGVPVSVGFRHPAAAQVVTYVGAGIYEEVLFRLGLFAVLCFVLRLVLLPKPIAVGIAAVAGALVFAAAHHVGESGEPLDAVRFLFRAAAGLYFTILYVARGFGVAVGAHAGYDILVGTAVG
ncbi:MAG: CPBP family glutamic-type intramembrane protease [Fimbriiglobus sp.]